MQVRWWESEDPDNPEHQRSEARFADGWLRAVVYHTVREDEEEVPWNARIFGAGKGHSLIGYESMEEAKRAVEAKMHEIVKEIRDFFGD